jgi:hypothetical protein
MAKVISEGILAEPGKNWFVPVVVIVAVALFRFIFSRRAVFIDSPLVRDI